MLSGMNEAFDRTLVYLKERKQFGVVIGSFQALKLRAARLYIELELSRSALMAPSSAYRSFPSIARAESEARCSRAQSSTHATVLSRACTCIACRKMQQ